MIIIIIIIIIISSSSSSMCTDLTLSWEMRYTIFPGILT